MEKFEVFKVALLNDNSCEFHFPSGMSNEEVLSVLVGIYVEFYNKNFDGDCLQAFESNLKSFTKEYDA